MFLNIAFLRAINVGGHTVKMATLRELFESIGFSNVETFIASGNVSFESADRNVQELENQIERCLRQALGYEVATFIRTPAELKAIVDYRPFPDSQPGSGGASLYIAFLHAEPGQQAQTRLMDYRTPINDFHVHGHEVYWSCAPRMSESTFSGALLEKALGMPATLRNVTTLRKLVAKLVDSK